MYVCKMYINDKWVGEGGWYNIRRAYNRTKNRAGFKRKKTNKSCRKVGGGGGGSGGLISGSLRYLLTFIGFLLSQRFELINSVIPLH